MCFSYVEGNSEGMVHSVGSSKKMGIIYDSDQNGKRRPPQTTCALSIENIIIQKPGTGRQPT